MKSRFRLFLLAFVGSFLFSMYGCGAVKVGSGESSAAQTIQDNRTRTQIRDDAKITSAVNAKLVKDRRIDALEIHVNTHLGIVTLGGHVHNSRIAERAVQHAKSVVGVRGVVAELEVRRH